MNKKLVLKSSLIVSVWLCVLIIGSVFTQQVLQAQMGNTLISQYVQMIMLYLFVIGVLLFISKMLHLDNVFKDLHVFNFQLGSVGIISIVLCFSGDIYLLIELIKTLLVQKHITEITVAEPWIFLMACVAYFLVGFSEELCFRGILLKLWTNHMDDQKGRWLKPALVISLVFGLVHLINLSNGLCFANVVYTITQVVFASMYGVLFAGIMCKTNSVFLCGLIHGTINLIGNSAELFMPLSKMDTISKLILDQQSILSGIITIIVVFPGFLWGIHICKNK